MNGFSANDEKRATHPCRELCGSGVKSRTTGNSRVASASSSNDGQVITSRATPTMTVAAAIMSAASGVKSAVISMRLPRGRAPIPVERRLAASNITGIGMMCVSSSASCSTVRLLPRSLRGSSNDTL